MSAELNPAAPHHLPAFITAPGETDVLMVVTAVFLLAVVVGFGVLFLNLHSLPERMAHKSERLQFEVVAVLALISLFTHIHWLWVAALLLALIDIPDFGGWLGRIAGAVEKMAGIKPREPEKTPLDVEAAQEKAAHETTAAAQEATAAPSDTRGRSAKDKELIHA
jgi:hypothetical protein